MGKKLDRIVTGAVGAGLTVAVMSGVHNSDSSSKDNNSQQKQELTLDIGDILLGRQLVQGTVSNVGDTWTLERHGNILGAYQDYTIKTEGGEVYATASDSLPISQGDKVIFVLGGGLYRFGLEYPPGNFKYKSTSENGGRVGERVPYRPIVAFHKIK